MLTASVPLGVPRVKAAEPAGGWLQLSVPEGSRPPYFTDRIRSLAVDPHDPDVLYLGNAICVDTPLVSKSVDGGETWSASAAGINAQGHPHDCPGLGGYRTNNWVSDIEVDPVDPEIVIATTQSHGLYRSEDGGRTWSRKASSILGFLGQAKITFDPTDRTHVYLTTGYPDELFESRDGGETWRDIVDGTMPRMSDLAVSPSDPDVVYGAGFMSGFWRSRDAGRSWEKLVPYFIKAIAVDPRDADHLVAGTYGGHGGILTSKDGGITWRQGLTGGTGPHVNAVAFNPGDPRLVYAVGSDLVMARSADGGDTWTSTAGGPSIVVTGLEISAAEPGRVYAFSQRDGLWRFDDAGIDTTPPVVTGAPLVPANAFGWHNADVLIDWESTDPQPSSGSATDPPHTRAGTEGAGLDYVSTESCDRAGNCATGSVRISLDKTPPAITATADPAPNQDGWWRSPVHVTFACEDTLSGVASCSDPVTLAGDGAAQLVTGTAVDRAGNEATLAVPAINIDTVAPALSFTGHHATYGVEEQIDIRCTAEDTGSGLAASECPTLSAPAHDFVGRHELRASATDRAGNSSSETATFDVVVTEEGICEVIRRLSSRVNVADQLCRKAHKLVVAAYSDDDYQARALIGFEHQVGLEVGRSLNDAEAALLIRLARHLASGEGPTAADA